MSEGDVSEGAVSEGDVSQGDISDNKLLVGEAAVMGESHGVTWELDEEGVLTISGKQESDSYVDVGGESPLSKYMSMKRGENGSGLSGVVPSK